MRWLLKMLGVTQGDMAAAERSGPALYVVRAALRSAARLAANHLPVPSLRVALFRWSGIAIGDGAQVNMDTVFLDDFEGGLIVIEDEVAVAPRVTFVAASHPNNSSELLALGLGRTAPVLVRRGAWIGAGAVILPGITIGRFAVVGANAVVTRDVPDYAVVAGIPAKILRDVRGNQ